MSGKESRHTAYRQRSMFVVGLIVVLAIALASQAQFWGFTQDDIYISLRYARHLALGQGLVFNPGEYVEGYTNFLWTLLAALFVTFRSDSLMALSIIGGASGIALVGVTVLLSGRVRGSRKAGWDLLAGLLLAGSSTLALWSASGLEQAPFTLLGWLAVLLALTGYARSACLVLLLTILTRPEGVLFLLFTLYLSAVEGGSFLPDRKRFLQGIAVVVALLALYALWKYLYFDSLVPNTYYVKGGGGWMNAQQGFSNFIRLCEFNGNGRLLVLALFAPLARGRRAVTVGLLAFLVTYCLYEIKIGGDFLPMFRLHLTILPAQCILAARGMEGISQVVTTVIKDEYRKWLTVAIPLFVLFTAGPASRAMFDTSWTHPEYAGTRTALENAHGALGRYLQSVAKPGDVVLAQDMGALPWYARDLVFVDAAGLVDRTVARIHYRTGYTPYIRYLLWADDRSRQDVTMMDAELRDYFFSRNPRYLVINVDFPPGQYTDVLQAMERRDEAFFQQAVNNNIFFNTIGQAQEWPAYRLVGGWPFSQVHHLLLYERAEGQ